MMYVARAMMHLQSLYGFFPRLLGKGDRARLLIEMLFRLRREQMANNATEGGGGSSSNIPSLGDLSTQIDALIILDRTCDLITPMLTQLTFEGLIDEMIGIRSCMFYLTLIRV